MTDPDLGVEMSRQVGWDMPVTRPGPCRGIIHIIILSIGPDHCDNAARMVPARAVRRGQSVLQPSGISVDDESQHM